jgi:hypothetical protein
MSATKRRVENWVALVLVAVGLVPAAVGGLFVYMKLAATPLHPNPKEVPSVPQSAPEPKWAGAVEQAREIARAALVEKNLPGLSVAVGTGGDIVWAEGFGWADLEKRIPVAPRTRFRIGTASMALTSAAVGLLLEKGRLKLDEEIQTYVPEYPDKQWHVTLRQLMAHVAGVPNDGGDEGPLFSVRCERPVDALKHFKESPLLFEPGTRYRYSSYGWILVSVNYRLTDPSSPEPVVFPTHNEDVAAAVAWVHGNIAQYGGDPGQIALLGHSAGAQIVASVGTDEGYLAAHDMTLSDVRCVGALDTEGFDVARQASAGNPIYRAAFGNDPATWDDASPLHHIAAGKDVPAFLVVERGTLARRLAQHAFVDALRAADIRVTVVDAGTLTHGQVNAQIGASGDTVMTPPLTTFLTGCFAE